MSLESSIAGFTTQAGLLLDLPQQLQTTALNRITEISQAYTARIANMAVTVYVNQVTGSDANPGTIALPIKTLQRALDMTPPDGSCTVFLQANYIVDAHVQVGTKILSLQSDGSTKWRVTFERYQEMLSSLYRGQRSFYVSTGHVNFKGLTIVVPTLDAGWTEITPFAQALINHGGSTVDAALSVTVNYCDYEIPAAPYCSFMVGSIYRLVWLGNTLTGAITSINGQIIRGVTATGGTAVTGRTDILTNLSTI